MAPVYILVLLGFGFFLSTFIPPVISAVVFIPLSNTDVAAIPLSTVVFALVAVDNASAAPTSPSTSSGSIHPNRGEIAAIVVCVFIVAWYVTEVMLLSMFNCLMICIQKVTQLSRNNTREAIANSFVT
jgi:hypothetical protein